MKCRKAKREFKIVTWRGQWPANCEHTWCSEVQWADGRESFGILASGKTKVDAEEAMRERIWDVIEELAFLALNLGKKAPVRKVKKRRV